MLAKLRIPARLLTYVRISTRLEVYHELGSAELMPTAHKTTFIIIRYAMNSDCPLVGMLNVLNKGTLCRWPMSGGAITYASKLVFNLVGTGMKRANESPIGIIAPVNRRTNLRGFKIGIQQVCFVSWCSELTRISHVLLLLSRRPTVCANSDRKALLTRVKLTLIPWTHSP